MEMPKLKKVFEDMGYKNVSTYINSGNVLFTSSHEDFSQINPVLEKVFGFPLRAIVRSKENIDSISKTIPEEWQNDTEQKTDILFLWDGFDSIDSIAQMRTNPEIDHLLPLTGAIAWNVCRTDYPKSGMKHFIGTIIYKNMTARNVNTVRKLAELMR